MDTQDPRGERYEAARSQYPPDDVYDDAISFRPLVRTLWSYRRVIVALVSAILIVFVLGGLGKYLRQPVERQASLEFRLIFEGADTQLYPNGLAFSTAEIISTPVLSEVYEINDLQRYCTYDQLKNGLFVLESSADLDLLALEYQAKLAEARLTAVDRARLEEEFRQKREALHVPQYKLNFVSPGGGARIPETLMSKVLNDVLATWAEQAAEQKGVLEYQIELLTPNIIVKEFVEAEDYIVRLDILRGKINRIIQNLGRLLELPGANVIRVGENRISLPEIRVNLEDILRYKVEPMVGSIRATGLSRNTTLLSQYLENRLFQIRLENREADSKVRVIQDSLRSYMMDRGTVAIPERADTSGGGSGGIIPGTPALIPQFGESFLDRLVAISSQNSDVEYRQKLTDEVIEAGEATVSFERERAYYEELLSSVRRLSPDGTRGTPDPAAVRAIEARFDEIYAAVVGALEQANAVYEVLSAQNLNPRTNLYTIISPFTIATQRAIGLRTLGLYGLLVVMVSLIVVSLACLIHHYFRREILPRNVVASRSQDEERPSDRTVRVESEESVISR